MNKKALTLNDYVRSDVIESLLSVNDFVRWVTTCLNSADLSYGHGYTDAVDEALILVLHAINMTMTVPAETFQSRLSVLEKRRIITLVEQRINDRVPVDYLTQQSRFAGLDFYVDERVLVPRSPIAELVEQGFEPWLQADSASRVLDLCTGSGCIGIACAYSFPKAQVDLADLSSDALAVAQINIAQHGLSNDVTAIKSDLFSALDANAYDLIVSNPPYVPQASYDGLPAEFDHEPEMGLVSGVDGLVHVTRILNEAADYLTEQGWLCVEVGEARDALEEKWPDVPFIWPDFERGGGDIFLLDRQTLRSHF
ncbi:MAG: 50S ribosomal protein L3 N(5)-glutamine methyltransferase [Gammaproteobacteria bacterium]|nr:50S ribosomal protein L3 N(5)-glutamine methyltransferase [Gammaproteobacteria bacterium]